MYKTVCGTSCSYGHLLLIAGHKWNYTFHKWGISVLIASYIWHITGMTRAIPVDFTSNPRDPRGTVALPRRSNSRSNSRRSSLASVRSDSPCLGSATTLPGAIGVFGRRVGLCL